MTEQIQCPMCGYHHLDKSSNCCIAKPSMKAETDVRKEQIRQVEEEIQQLLDDSGDTGWGDSLAEPAYRRILAREQAVLAELRKGMR